MMLFPFQDLAGFIACLFFIRLPTWGIHTWYANISEGFCASMLAYLLVVTKATHSAGTQVIAANRASTIFLADKYDWVVFVSREFFGTN